MITNAIATEVRNAAQFMAVDELSNLQISGDGLKNADNRADVDRLLELEAIMYDGHGYYHVNNGYESFFDRLQFTTPRGLRIIARMMIGILNNASKNKM